MGESNAEYTITCDKNCLKIITDILTTISKIRFFSFDDDTDNYSLVVDYASAGDDDAVEWACLFHKVLSDKCIQNYSYVIQGYIFYGYYDASYYAWHIEGTQKGVIANSCYFDVEYEETEEFEDSDRYEKEFDEARRKAYEDKKKKKKKYLSKKEEQQYLKSMLEHYLLSQKYHPFEVDQIIEWIRK